MNEDAIVAAIKAELHRQSRLPQMDTPYLYNSDDESDIWGVDGYVDIRDLARALRSHFENEGRVPPPETTSTVK